MKKNSSKVWFTADTHFQHGLESLGRPWSGSETMDRHLIGRWNDTVAPGDQVVHLGDFAMGLRTQIPDLLARLHGTIILVAGNHDFRRHDRYFGNVIRGHDISVQVGSTVVEVAHNPIHLLGKSEVALCGHVHSDWAEMAKGQQVRGPRHGPKPGEAAFVAPCRIFNVGVDVRDFRPVTLEELLAGTAPVTNGRR